MAVSPVILAPIVFLLLGTDQEVPYFEETTCQQDDITWITTACGSNCAEKVCGFLVVPENRNDPESETIKVYTSIYAPAGGFASSSTPTLFLNGGPGAANYYFYYYFADTTSTVRQSIAANSNIILLDQRGTNYSEPSLFCQSMGDYREQAYSWTWQEEGEGRVPLLEACYEEYVASGIDLAGYNSKENAADIRDLLIALKKKGLLEQDTVNVYAASYGTRLAMLAMKWYPEIFNSVVLDSILPPETNPFVKEAPGTIEALNALFAAALTDYPDLETYFYAISERLTSTPVVTPLSVSSDRVPSLRPMPLAPSAFREEYTVPLVPTLLKQQGDGLTTPLAYAETVTYPDNVTVTAPMFVDYVASKLRSTPYDVNLPYNIYNMYHNSDYSELATRWVSRVNYDYPADAAGTDTTAEGMFSSVFGANDSYYTGPAQIEYELTTATDDEGIREWLRHEFIYKRPGIMGKWPVSPLASTVREPLVSDIPTLMLVGELDVATPSIFSRDSAAALSNSFYFVLPAGHAVGLTTCAQEMITAFYADPATEPTNNCSSTYTWTAWP